MMYLYPRATVTNYHKLGSLKPYKSILIQFWRLESKIKELISLVPSGGPEREYVPYLSAGIQWLPAILDIPLPVDSSHKSLPPFSPLLLWVHVSFLLFTRHLLLDGVSTWIIVDDVIQRPFNYLHLQRSFFWMESHSQISGGHIF